MKNLAEMFRLRVAETQDRAAVTFLDQTFSWAELYQLAAGVRALLQEKGVGRGDVVGVLTDHSVGQLCAFLGVVMADATFTLISPHASRDQMISQISDSQTQMILAAPRFEKSISQLAEDRFCDVAVMDEFGQLRDREPLTDVDAARDAGTTRAVPNDVACLMYTSGSTGRPKGVVVPHKTLTDGARIVSGVLNLAPEDKILCLLPFAFDYGLNQILSTIHVGASAVIFNFLLPADLFDCIEKNGVTGLASVPSFWPSLFDPRYASAATPERFASLRYVTTAGGPHPEALLRKLDAFFPSADLHIFYGLTESFRSTHLQPSEIFKRIGSIGKAVPEVEILVLDDDGAPVLPGQKGVLHHRGAFVTYGYLNHPELTAATFCERHTGGPGTAPERIIRSGDLVSLDADGFIYFHGRVDNMIKTRGFRVSPGEIEQAAVGCPHIKHVGAFGLPSATLGQEIVLAYDAADQEEVDQKELKKRLKQLLPYYAVPQRLIRLDALPKTPNGKIDYKVLKRMAEDMEEAV